MPQQQKPRNLSEAEIEKLDKEMWKWHQSKYKVPMPQMDRNALEQLRDYQHAQMIRKVYKQSA